MRPYLQEEYGNPSSKYYLLAAHAADAVENSREWVAKLMVPFQEKKSIDLS